MKSILLKIKQKRQDLGLSQVDLAAQSGVSLPTLQRIESGHANPSLQNLEALAKSLGLKFKCEDQSVDWDVLVSYGLPLQSQLPIKSLTKTQGELLKVLSGACSLKKQKKTDPELARKKEALIGLLLALKLHYSSIYRKLCQKCPIADRLLPKAINGKHIKLKRLAMARLGTYL